MKNKQNNIRNEKIITEIWLSKLLMFILLIIAVLTYAEKISFEKYIDDFLAIFLILLVMSWLLYDIVRKAQKIDKSFDDKQIEERGFTKEGVVGVAGLFIFILGFLFAEKLFVMILTNILGLAVAGSAVYLQYKKPMTNKYVLRNAKYYFFALLGMVIWFAVVLILTFFTDVVTP